MVYKSTVQTRMPHECRRPQRNHQRISLPALRPHEGFFFSQSESCNRPQSSLQGATVLNMSQELHVLGAFTPYGLSVAPTPSGDTQGQVSEARYFLFESEASEHRLDATALGYSTRDENYQSKIGLGADGVFAAVNAEEEIFVHRNTVVWSSGGCVRKSFTLAHPIIQAMLVNFHMTESRMEDSTDKPSYASDLCVLHSGT